MAKLVKVQGARSDWTAVVDGQQRLAVIHNTWRVGADGYHDPMVGATLDGKRYVDYVDLLRRTDRVVMQTDAPDGSLARSGYIGILVS